MAKTTKIYKYLASSMFYNTIIINHLLNEISPG